MVFLLRVNREKKRRIRTKKFFLDDAKKVFVGARTSQIFRALSLVESLALSSGILLKMEKDDMSLFFYLGLRYNTNEPFIYRKI